MASYFKDLEGLSVVEESFIPTIRPSSQPVTTTTTEEVNETTSNARTVIDVDDDDDVDEEEEFNEGTFIDPDEEEMLEAIRRQQLQDKLNAEHLLRQDAIKAENQRLEEEKKRREEAERIRMEAEAIQQEKERQARERAMQYAEFLKKLKTMGLYFYTSMVLTLISVILFFWGAYSCNTFDLDVSLFFYPDDDTFGYTGYWRKCYGSDIITQKAKSFGRFVSIIGTFLIPLIFVTIGASLYLNYSPKFYYYVMAAMTVMSLFTFLLVVGTGDTVDTLTRESVEYEVYSYSDILYGPGGKAACVGGVSWFFSAIFLYLYIRKCNIIAGKKEDEEKKSTETTPDNTEIQKGDE